MAFKLAISITSTKACASASDAVERMLADDMSAGQKHWRVLFIVG